MKIRKTMIIGIALALILVGGSFLSAQANGEALIDNPAKAQTRA